MKSFLKLCVVAATLVTALCATDALQGCSAPQRATERAALATIPSFCPTAGAVAALVVPGAGSVDTDTVCLVADEAADLLRRLLARRTVAKAYAKAHPGSSAVPSAVLEPCPATP